VNKTLDLAILFSALADPTRLRLLNLMNGREVCVCYFVQILRQPQPKISRHLAYMRKAGIVSARRDGKWMHYSITVPHNKEAASILRATLGVLAGQKRMQADSSCLNRACCRPQRFRLTGAPVPSGEEIAH
jgi:ArsR family transcriptional regulator